MANRLKPERQEAVLRGLVEGCSIRSVERMTGVHRDTICRLLVRAGDGCAKLHNEMMRDLPCQRIEMDEIWTFVHKKQRWVTAEDDPYRVGDQWTWVALDPDTKIVPAYRVGKRNAESTQAFVADLASRLANRVQLSSDALGLYVDAVERAFGPAVAFAQVVKSYEAEPIGPGRYSPPRVASVSKHPIVGSPDPRHASTSLVERQNRTMRMGMRRFTRLTDAFSKKVENLRAAVSLHFAYYNLVRTHRSLRMTPAMAAGVTNRVWSLRNIVEATE